MFWDDIKDIKLCLNSLSEQMIKIEHNISQDQIEDTVKGAFDDVFCSTEEYNSINRINDKLNLLLVDSKRLEAVDLAEQTLDKFEDYMKNVDKLNGMINEFKGCVSMARAALDHKKDSQDYYIKLAETAKISEQIYIAMGSFIAVGNRLCNQNSKIEAIYEFLIKDKEEKEKPKKRVRTRKKPIAP
jgi:hypothetical protein